MHTRPRRTARRAFLIFQLPLRLTLLSVTLLTAPPNARADATRADSHAPIGVMADHTHKAGEIMLSYRYMRMRMEGNRSGRRRQSPAEVRALGFPVAPTDMDMNMHMFGIMWVPLDRLTLMAMIPYVDASMDHVRLVSTPRFTTKSSGIGDIRLGGLVSFLDTKEHNAHIGIGISIPSGSTRHRDFIIPFGEVQLPYPMQIGSGSWSFLPSATYSGRLEDWAWGVQASGDIRLNENDLGYTLGDRANATVWLSRLLCTSLSASFRLNFDHWGNIDGADKTLTLAAPPTSDPRRRGGSRLEAGFGANYAFGLGPLNGMRLALEFLHPITQKLDGPQLETDWNVVAGLQYAF